MTIAAPHASVIIPARGGSKGVPHKNIKQLAGAPLIAHSILQAKEATTVSHVFVSTDDIDIKEVAERYGAHVIDRPPQISGDTASSESALLHALSPIRSADPELGLIVFLQCTCPIRLPTDIDAAVRQLIESDADSLLSVAPTHSFFWTIEGTTPKPINYDYRHRPRRQDIPPQYVENGSIYIFKPWVLEKYHNRLGGRLTLYVMDEMSAFEIDTWFDFELVDFVMNRKGLTR